MQVIIKTATGGTDTKRVKYVWLSLNYFKRLAPLQENSTFYENKKDVNTQK